MILSICMKGDYEYFNALKAAKNKPNCRPSAGIRNNLDGDQTTAPKAQLKGCDLKKQSQFSKGRTNLIVCIERDYEYFHVFGRRKNKANSKPIKANSSKPPWPRHW